MTATLYTVAVIFQGHSVTETSCNNARHARQEFERQAEQQRPRAHEFEVALYRGDGIAWDTERIDSTWEFGERPGECHPRPEYL